MTRLVMDRRALLGKSADADLLREMIGFAAERLMEPELGAKTGADFGERSADRLTQRDSYRDRDWQMRAGNLELRIPRQRIGSYFPSFAEPRRALEKVLTAVVLEACVSGVSRRAMEGLVQAMGGTGISQSQVSRLCEAHRVSRRPELLRGWAHEREKEIEGLPGRGSRARRAAGALVSW